MRCIAATSSSVNARSSRRSVTRGSGTAADDRSGVRLSAPADYGRLCCGRAGRSVACPTMSSTHATEGFPLSGASLRDRTMWVAQARRFAIPAGLVAVAVFAVVALGGPLQTFADALRRAVSADARWVVAGAGFEALSFTGYILLLWHVIGRATPRVGIRESAQITLAGAA